jgi:putative NADH-flavin reductase
MRVVVFGASGATGRELVAQALVQGQQVTSFARQTSRLSVRSGDVNVVQGDVMDPSAVARAVEGQNAVLCALGAATPLRRDRTLVEGVRHIVDAMDRQSARRLVYLSFLGVREGRRQLSFVGRVVVAPLLLRKVVADHEAKERIIRQSGLDWVIVRPPRLTNGPRRGVYRHGVDIRATSLIPRISRADLADFMLRQLTDDVYVRNTPAVMY